MSLLTNAQIDLAAAVLEVLLEGPDEFDRTKQALVDGLAGKWATVATDRFGTFVAQKCYTAARLQRKQAMVRELAKSLRALSGSSHGRHVLRTCRVELFDRNPDQWLAGIRGAERRRQMFESITGKADGASFRSLNMRRIHQGSLFCNSFEIQLIN